VAEARDSGQSFILHDPAFLSTTPHHDRAQDFAQGKTSTTRAKVGTPYVLAIQVNPGDHALDTQQVPGSKGAQKYAKEAEVVLSRTQQLEVYGVAPGFPGILYARTVP
jgi:hypothetical protein